MHAHRGGRHAHARAGLNAHGQHLGSLTIRAHVRATAATMHGAPSRGADDRGPGVTQPGRSVFGSSPEQIRTAVTALRGRRPRPLDDGAGCLGPRSARCLRARGGGLEPPKTGPEPVVLPITPPPNGRRDLSSRTSLVRSRLRAFAGGAQPRERPLAAEQVHRVEERQARGAGPRPPRTAPASPCAALMPSASIDGAEVDRLRRVHSHVSTCAITASSTSPTRSVCSTTRPTTSGSIANVVVGDEQEVHLVDELHRASPRAPARSRDRRAASRGRRGRRTARVRERLRRGRASSSSVRAGGSTRRSASRASC